MMITLQPTRTVGNRILQGAVTGIVASTYLVALPVFLKRAYDG